MRIRKKKAAVRALAVSAMATIGATTAMALPANADLDGRCDWGWEVCFYWGDNTTGAGADFFASSQWDFGDIRYPANGTGAGSRVKNNAASVYNTSDCWAFVYYNEGYTGPYDSVAPRSWRNLWHAYNENASFNTWYCP